MSNRGDFVGTAPNSGNYIPAPVPADKEDLPVYVNDELLRLGGTVNGVLEGGALPPHSKLPKRFKEGMIMNFSQAVSDEIYSSGVWLYKNAKWWKLIDDPTEIGLSKFIYLTTPGSTQPATPAPSAGTPPGWNAAPTVKASKSDWIWVASSIDYDFKTKVYTWSEPVAWSAGVADGGAGESFETWFADSPFRPETPEGYPPVGPDGVVWTVTPATNEGAIIWAVTALVKPSNPDATVWTFPVQWNGTEGQRGFLGINVPGTAWSDEVAWDAIVQETSGVSPNRPIPWDNVTIYDNDTAFAVTKRFVRGVNKPGTWEEVAHVIDGDMIVRGTLSGDALVANAVTTDKLAAGAVSADKIAANAITGVKIDSATTIRAGTGNQSASLDGADSKWRIYAGSSTPANAPFRVDKDGNVFASSGTFGGEIFAKELSGEIASGAVIPYEGFIKTHDNSVYTFNQSYTLARFTVAPVISGGTVMPSSISTGNMGSVDWVVNGAGYDRSNQYLRVITIILENEDTGQKYTKVIHNETFNGQSGFTDSISAVIPTLVLPVAPTTNIYKVSANIRWELSHGTRNVSKASLVAGNMVVTRIVNTDTIRSL